MAHDLYVCDTQIVNCGLVDLKYEPSHITHVSPGFTVLQPPFI